MAQFPWLFCQHFGWPDKSRNRQRFPKTRADSNNLALAPFSRCIAFKLRVDSYVETALLVLITGGRAVSIPLVHSGVIPPQALFPGTRHREGKRTLTDFVAKQTDGRHSRCASKKEFDRENSIMDDRNFVAVCGTQAHRSDE